MKLVSYYRALFAKRIALKSTLAILLALVIPLLLNLNSIDDYAWIVPLGVVASLIMYPAQLGKYQLIGQRSIGIWLGIIPAFAATLIFKQWPIVLMIYAVISTLFFAMRITTHFHKVYVFSLALIFSDFLLCFALASPHYYYLAALKFPFLLSLTWLSLTLADLSFSGSYLKNKLPEMQQKTFNLLITQLADLSQKNSDMSWFYYFETLLNTAKKQLPTDLFNQYHNNCQHLRSIAIKLNQLANCLHLEKEITIIFLPEIRAITRHLELTLQALAKKEAINLAPLEKAILQLHHHFEKSEYTHSINFRTVLHQLTFIVDDLMQINSLTTAGITITTVPAVKEKKMASLLFASRVTATICLPIAAILWLKLGDTTACLIIAIAISTLPNLGNRIFQGVLRTGGMFIGAITAFAVGSLFTHFDNLFAVILVTSLFFYLNTRWSMRFSKLSYFGIAASLLFMISLLLDSGAYFAITMQATRIENILAGALIALFSNILLAPALPSMQIRKQLSAAIQDIRTYLNSLLDIEQLDPNALNALLNKIRGQISNLENILMSAVLKASDRRKAAIALSNLQLIAGELNHLYGLLFTKEKLTLPATLPPLIRNMVNESIATNALHEELLSMLITSNNPMDNKFYVCFNVILQQLELLTKVISKAERS